jgi:hypothetical protein
MARAVELCFGRPGTARPAAIASSRQIASISGPISLRSCLRMATPFGPYSSSTSSSSLMSVANRLTEALVCSNEARVAANSKASTRAVSVATRAVARRMTSFESPVR